MPNTQQTSVLIDKLVENIFLACSDEPKSNSIRSKLKSALNSSEEEFLSFFKDLEYLGTGKTCSDKAISLTPNHDFAEIINNILIKEQDKHDDWEFTNYFSNWSKYENIKTVAIYSIISFAALAVLGYVTNDHNNVLAGNVAPLTGAPAYLDMTAET